MASPPKEWVLQGFYSKRGLRNGNSFDVLNHAGSFMELAIGASLIIIGLLGIKEAPNWRVNHLPLPNVFWQWQPPPRTPPGHQPQPAKCAVLFNGTLHVFSWDATPSLVPAVAISTLQGLLAFLISYAVWTMVLATKEGCREVGSARFAVGFEFGEKFFGVGCGCGLMLR